MTFLDGHAGDDNNSLNIRSQGFSDGTDWNALTTLDILENPDTAFVWSKWEPLELWYQKEHSSGYRE